jgi:hypothetical protein
VKVVTGFFKTARIRHTTTATPTNPATPPREERAATTALVSQTGELWQPDSSGILDLKQTKIKINLF